MSHAVLTGYIYMFKEVRNQSQRGLGFVVKCTPDDEEDLKCIQLKLWREKPKLNTSLKMIL